MTQQAHLDLDTVDLVDLGAASEETHGEPGIKQEFANEQLPV